MHPPKKQHKRKIAIVDDHVVFRHGLRGLLEEIGDLEVIFEAENGLELIDKIESEKPDVIFLDIEMPVMDGIKATVLVKDKYPDMKIIILSMHYEEALVNHLIEKGANGFLSKNMDFDTLVCAMNRVFENGYYLDFNRMPSKLPKKIKTIPTDKVFARPNLSDREVEVARLMCKEYTNREVAELLCISPRTVDTYRNSIMTKTKAKNLAGVVLYMLKYDLL